MRSALLAILLLLSCIGGGEASDLPRYNVEQHCSKIAKFGGSMSEALRESCFDMEQKAYDTLKASWGDLPSSMRRHCHGIATFGGDGSYSLLESCIEIERQAQENNKTRRFRY